MAARDRPQSAGVHDLAGALAARGWTSQQLAVRLSVPHRTVRRWLNGGGISSQNEVAVAQALGLVQREAGRVAAPAVSNHSPTGWGAAVAAAAYEHGGGNWEVLLRPQWRGRSMPVHYADVVHVVGAAGRDGPTPKDLETALPTLLPAVAADPAVSIPGGAEVTVPALLSSAEPGPREAVGILSPLLVVGVPAWGGPGDVAALAAAACDLGFRSIAVQARQRLALSGGEADERWHGEQIRILEGHCQASARGPIWASSSGAAVAYLATQVAAFAGLLVVVRPSPDELKAAAIRRHDSERHSVEQGTRVAGPLLTPEARLRQWIAQQSALLRAIVGRSQIRTLVLEPPRGYTDDHGAVDAHVAAAATLLDWLADHHDGPRRDRWLGPMSAFRFGDSA